MNSLRSCGLVLLTFWLAFFARPAQAHPMGNFSINHYARFQPKAGIHGDELALRYILDFAEIPTADRMPEIDTNGDNTVSPAEKANYLRTAAGTLLSGLSVTLESRPVTLHPAHSDLEVRPGAGGLPTLRVWVDCGIDLPSNPLIHVTYRDSNFEGRTGWMEIIAVGGQNHSIRDSNASSSDQSRGLTIFPIDSGIVPPRQTQAAFTVATGSAGTGVNTAAGIAPTAVPVAAANNQTPQNRFTQSIAETRLTPVLVLGGLFFAFTFGAVHALSPGHGKTMVAAYLVGSRGTPRHAVLLGLVVTITHTFGVFVLGLALLFASRYIMPERLFPALSALSGLLIFGVGLWLFMSRWQGLTGQSGGHSHSHGDHSHAHDEHSHDGHSHDGHSHDGHSHDHHSHGDHSHEDPGLSGHTHSHGGVAHSHAVPEGPITMKTLVALGISGGIVPCPEALVVLLAAVKLHRLGYGMVLITAFSIGLAMALISIGMLVVSARQRLSRFNSLSEGGVLVRYLPIASAAVITLIGAALTLRAATGTP